MSLLASALKRSRDVDETKQLLKRAKQQDLAEKVVEHAALLETYSLAPLIECSAVNHDEILTISLKDAVNTCNTVLLFYDYDFTPTAIRDIRAFNDRIAEFNALSAQVLAISVDTEHCHYAFLQREFPGGSAKIPLLADTTKRTTRDYLVLNEETGVARRSVFIIDKIGQIRFWYVLQHHQVEHNVDSVLSVLMHLP